MAEIIESVNGSIKQSIARVELETSAKTPMEDWSLTYHFEDGMYDSANALVGNTNFGTRRVTRRFGDISKTSITAAGITATVAQVAALIKAAGYILRAEDIEKAATPPTA